MTAILKSAQKGGGGVTNKALTSRLLISGVPSPKGAKVYPASRRRSNKRVGLKRQLAPHCVPWLNSIMAYKRLSTSLGSKTLNNTSSSGLGGTKT